MMRENSTSGSLIVPALLVASVLHAAVIFGLRVNLARQRPAYREALEIALEPASMAESPRQFTAASVPPQSALKGTMSTPSVSSEVPVGETAPLKHRRPVQGVSGEKVLEADSARDGDSGAALEMPGKRRATHSEAAWPHSAETVDSVAALSRALQQADLADSATAPTENGASAAHSTGVVAAASTSPSGHQHRKPGVEAAPVPFSGQTVELENAPPARLTAASLGQQVSEWSAEYLGATQEEPTQPSRTAYLEKVGSHRVAAAAYERAWQDKVERVGNMNYPEDARRKNLTGGLMLAVAVNADGSVNSIHVRSSSGHEELDQAAIRIVRLAAPFAAFPSELKVDYDVLWITRTWRFFIDNHLATVP